MRHVISFTMSCQTNSELPFLLFIDTFVGVTSQGADFTKSKYHVLWGLLSRVLLALNIYVAMQLYDNYVHYHCLVY